MLGLRSPWRRHDPRQELMSQVAGTLASDAHRAIPFEARDLSDHGLRLITQKSLTVGEQVTLEIVTPRALTLRGHVRWCQETNDKESNFIVGVELGEDSSKLDALFSAIDAANF